MLVNAATSLRPPRPLHLARVYASDRVFVRGRLTRDGLCTVRRDLDSGAQLSQRRGVPQQKLSQMSHPLLGDRPTLQLMPSRTDIAGKPIHPPPQPHVKFQMRELSEKIKVLLDN